MAKNKNLKNKSANKITEVADKNISVVEQKNISAENESAPKVSVILSSYNQGKYVAQSIQSVLNQTFTDFELLIFDDGSTDNSQEIIKSFSDDRIKLFLYEKNRGPFEAIKEPLQVARGKYIAIHHSDDVWKSTKLEKQVDFLEKNPDYAVCFSQVDFIDESGEIYDLPETHPYKTVFSQKNRSREEWLNHLFWNMSSFCNPSALIVNDKNYYIFNPSLFQLSDYFMWLNVCKQKNIYIFEDKLIKFRLRRTVQDSMSSSTIEKAVRNKNESYFTAKEFFSLTENVQEFLKIFPEAEKYVIDGEIQTKFAFAKLCLEHGQIAYNKLGLEILYNLLHDSKSVAKIKKLYDYDYRNFIKDTGEVDTFGMKFQLKILKSRLYLDYGQDFNQNDSVEKEVLVSGNGDFYVRFNSQLKSPVQKLRFDPDERGGLSVKLKKIILNGEEVKADFSNEIKVDGEGNYIFLTSDPWYVIDKKVDAQNLQFEIFGKVDFNSAMDVADKVFREQKDKINRQNAEIVRQSSELHRQADELNRQNGEISRQQNEMNRLTGEISRQSSELHRQAAELNRLVAEVNQKDAEITQQVARIKQLETELNKIGNSTSWKITAPLRSAGKFFKQKN